MNENIANIKNEQENKLTKKELNQIWRRWGCTHLSSMSYEKIQGHSWAFAFLPFAKKYYGDNPEAMRRFLVRHSQFYNTEPQTGQIINGIVTSLEEEIALGHDVPEEMPVNIKTTLMGPIAGIGDSIIQGIIVPVLLSIGMGLAAGGNPLGPIFYILSYGIIGPMISYLSFRSGYRLGVNAIDVIIGEDAKRITDAFNVLGVTVIGGLAASNIALTSQLMIPMGTETQPLQNVLDSIFPGILPLSIVMLAWYLISKKQVGATRVILILTVLITAGVIVGVF
ncbi:MAG: PTS system mannose/fructose/sorbose family transporter subunit IID [Tissierellia bacterium]|nr:PTS system mannose/fructose/sorbose family transporter subunit IID [Tissierellia bacterium]